MRNFIVQQGFGEPSQLSCSSRFGALQFQPRVVGLLFLFGVFFQSPWYFLGLSAVLWVCALVPALNPFEIVYNSTLGRRPGAERLTLAPAPRRFAQGMAATFTLSIGLALLWGKSTWAIGLQGMMALALLALVLGGFCLGSVVYHLMRGDLAMVKATWPWSTPNERRT